MEPRRWPTYALYGALALYLGLAVRQTVVGREAWPLSAYAMFNRVPPERLWIPRVQLDDDRGGSRIAPPESLLPVEFFRAQSMLSTGLRAGASPAARRAFVQALLARLNEGGWRGLLEREHSIEPPPGARFTQLKLVEVQIEPSPIDASAVTLDVDPLYDSAADR